MRLYLEGRVVVQTLRRTDNQHHAALLTTSISWPPL
jgi:hypothetical protein